MDAKTLEALRGSIAKWKAIVDGTGKDYGGDNCPLCRLFYDGREYDESLECEGCPVREHSGDQYCWGTPYEKWSELTKNSRGRANTPEKKAAAQAELDFLISLLPEGQKP
jgi:hypothetical protein